MSENRPHVLRALRDAIRDDLKRRREDGAKRSEGVGVYMEGPVDRTRKPCHPASRSHSWRGAVKEYGAWRNTDFRRSASSTKWKLQGLSRNDRHEVR